MKNAQVKLTVDTQSAVKSVGDLNNEINETAEVTKTLKQQLREMTIELQGLEPGTAEFNKMTAAAGQLRDQIADTNAAINATAGSSVENLAGAVTNMAGVGISAFQGIAGAQAMFGEDSEELMKLMAKLQGAMALGQALKDFGALGDTFTNIKAQLASVTAGSQLFSKATVAQAVATGTATNAQKVMNAVMNANPIFLIITGIIALVAAFAIFSSSSEEAAEDQAKLNEEFNKSSDSIKQLNENLKDLRATYTKGDALKSQEALIKAEDALTDILRERPKDYNSILSAQKTVNDAQIKLIQDEAKARKDAFAEEILVNQDRLTTLNNQQYQSNEEGKKQREQDFAEAQAIRAFLDKSIQETRNIEMEGSNAILKATLDAENKLAEIRKKRLDEQIANSKTLSDTQLNLYLENIATEREAIVERDKIEREKLNVIFAASKKTIEDKQNLNNALIALDAKLAKDLAALQSAEDNANAEKRKAAILKLETEINDLKRNLLNAQGIEAVAIIVQQHEKEKQLLKAQMEDALSNKKLTEEEKLKITSDYLLKIAQLEKDYRDKSLKSETDTTEVIKTELQKRAEAILEFYSKISATVQLGLDTMQMAFDLYNENQAAKREEQYVAEEEAIKDSLANRLISQEEYDNQVAALENQKQQKERAAKKKQFDQDKANNIINAIMSGAQAVLAALTLPPPLSYVLAAVNGALAATQIGIISSQKFHASRGGVVPGPDSKVDSVDASLAPGEMVINSSSASMFPTLLSEINKAGGGIPLAPEPVSNLTSGGRNIYAPSTQRIEAYVVESQLSSTSRRVRRMEESASF